MFDEFQEVANLGKDVLPKMRAEFQKHKGVTYVFGEQDGYDEANIPFSE
ncbi:hypothetical protein [Thermococcus chitonophagus]|nr:hypothetical protein [Thermococcus chitonophagus]